MPLLIFSIGKLRIEESLSKFFPASFLDELRRTSKPLPNPGFLIMIRLSEGIEQI